MGASPPGNREFDNVTYAAELAAQPNFDQDGVYVPASAKRDRSRVAMEQFQRDLTVAADVAATMTWSSSDAHVAYEAERAAAEANVLSVLRSLDLEADEWREDHLQPHRAADSIVFPLQALALRLHSFFSGPPDSQVIPPELQARELAELAWLRFKSLIGPLSFDEQKKLALSSKLPLYQNVKPGQSPVIATDRALEPLVLAVNSNSHLAVHSNPDSPCCSGHLWQNPGDGRECIFQDSGSLSLRVRRHVDNGDLKDRLRELVEVWNTANSDCLFRLIMISHPRCATEFWDLIWRWDSESSVENRELISVVISGQITGSDLDAARARIFEIGRQARHAGIPDRHAAFIQAVADLINRYR